MGPYARKMEILLNVKRLGQQQLSAAQRTVFRESNGLIKRPVPLLSAYRQRPLIRAILLVDVFGCLSLDNQTAGLLDATKLTSNHAVL